MNEDQIKDAAAEVLRNDPEIMRVTEGRIFTDKKRAHPEIVVKDELGNTIPIVSVRYEENAEDVWLIEVTVDDSPRLGT